MVFTQLIRHQKCNRWKRYEQNNMHIIDGLKISAKIFKTQKTRTALSILGVVIGIMSVIAIINAGEILKGYIKGSVEVFGTDYIEVEIKIPNTSQTSTENAMGQAAGISITTLKHEDTLAIAEHPNIKDVYSAVLGQDLVSYKDVNKVGYLWGVSSGFFRIDKTEIVMGREFTEDDDSSLAQVVVLGDSIKQDLFGDTNPIGQMIKINKRNFKVIGVRDRVGFMDIYDDMILMPLQTLQKKVMGIQHISFLIGSLKNTAQSAQTVAEITDIMREQHDITDPNKEDFAVTSSEDAMAMLDSILNAMTIFLVAIAGISLIVGGVGIMNIMYVSVLERTYEIGLRKAIGAKKSDILIQFLGEAVIITSLGGIVGVVFGLILTWIIVVAAKMANFPVHFIISISGVITAVAFMVLTGILFGLYPAKQAAELNPVEALRHE